MTKNYDQIMTEIVKQYGMTWDEWQNLQFEAEAEAEAEAGGGDQ